MICIDSLDSLKDKDGNVYTLEMLQYAIENDIIDLAHVTKCVEMKKKNEYLNRHTNKVWYGKDERWHTYLPDNNGGRKHIKKTHKEDLDKLIIEYWKKQEKRDKQNKEERILNTTFYDLFVEWNNRRLDLKKISPATYTRNQQTYNRHMKDFGKKKVISIHPDEIIDFLEEQIAEYNLSAKSFANLKIIMRGMLRLAKRKKYISFNIEEMFNDMDISDRVFKKNIKEDYQEVFSEMEMPVICNYLIENKDCYNLGILLMFVTGMRVGEVVALKKEDIRKGTIHVRRTETKYRDRETQKFISEVKDYPKTAAGVRTIVLPTEYKWLTKSLLLLNPFANKNKECDEYIFVKDGVRIKTEMLRRRLYRICDNLHIYRKSPHKIRKTYGTILLDNNVDKRFIQDQMGHSDISCTENFYHRNRKNLEKKEKILSNISDFQL